tara:strand:- start:7616 stop:7843 length:228 start_codon:yes stop_codon:yes gene_type:complete
MFLGTYKGQRAFETLSAQILAGSYPCKRSAYNYDLIHVFHLVPERYLARKTKWHQILTNKYAPRRVVRLRNFFTA